MNNNFAIYDALSTTLRSDKVPSLELLKVTYEQSFSNKAEGDTIGGTRDLKRVARGRYEGKVLLEFFKDDWDFFKSQYEAKSSIFHLVEGIQVFITYLDPQSEQVRRVETLHIGFKSEKIEGLDREGGKALTVKVEGLLLAPVSSSL